MHQQKNPNILFWLVPAALLYAAGFAAAAKWDLALDQAVYAPGNPFAISMEVLGWYPAFLPPLCLALLLAGQRPLYGTRRIWQPVGATLVAAGGFAALSFASYGYLVKRGMLGGLQDPLLYIWLAAGLVFCAVLVLLVRHLGQLCPQRMLFFTFWGTVYTVANQAVTYPIKTLWARTRFDDMLTAGSFDAFTPWYRPLGHGGSSFPSGHTANAAGIFVLLILCDLFPAWHRRRHWVYAFCWVYIAAMAAARILIGRHFLSDTLAASGLMALLFFALRRTPFYRRGIARLAQAPAA